MVLSGDTARNKLHTILQVVENN